MDFACSHLHLMLTCLSEGKKDGQLTKLNSTARTLNLENLIRERGLALGPLILPRGLANTFRDVRKTTWQLSSSFFLKLTTS